MPQQDAIKGVFLLLAKKAPDLDVHATQAG
jgi:hypothetical protein